MKSLENLYNEAQANEELKKDFISAFKEGRVEDFLSAHNCDATAADVMKYLSSTKEETASEDDLAKVAAGGCGSTYTCPGHSCGCASYWC